MGVLEFLEMVVFGVLYVIGGIYFGYIILYVLFTSFYFVWELLRGDGNGIAKLNLRPQFVRRRCYAILCYTWRVLKKGCSQDRRRIAQSIRRIAQSIRSPIPHKERPTQMVGERNEELRKDISQYETRGRDAVPPTRKDALEPFDLKEPIVRGDGFRDERFDLERTTKLSDRSGTFEPIDALLGLANYYETVDTSPNNDVMMIECFKRAADLGSAEAMSKLASYHFKGRGCAVNKARAIEWMNKAIALGYLPASARERAVFEGIKATEKSEPLTFRPPKKDTSAKIKIDLNKDGNGR